MSINIFFVFVFVFSLSAISCQEQKCSEQIKVSDRCLQNAILIGRENLTLPQTVPELDKALCTRINEDFRCVVGMRKCFKPVLRTMFSEIIRSARQTLKSICKTPKAKMEAIGAMKCFRPSDIKLLKSIIDKFTSVLEYGSLHEPTDNLIGYTCCAYFIVAEETKRDLDDLCQPRNHGDGSKLILKIIAAIAGDTEVGCGKFSSANTCRTLLPLSVVHIESQLRNYTATEPKTVSPLIPMLKVFERLDE
ncbi:hypothetical protein HDE_01187 [Halotydeus destructor]|nr:hypothetical protein HDE_01187 [Halotydeus destructor]